MQEEPTSEAATQPAAETQTKEKVKTGRLIVRNIQFDTTEKHLKSLFKGFGQINEVNIPMKTDKPHLNRGFAFIELENKEVAMSAVEKLNNSKF